MSNQLSVKPIHNIKYHIVTVLFLITGNRLYAQYENTLDSLQGLLTKVKDTTQLTNMTTLAGELIPFEVNKSLTYHQQALNIAEALAFQSGLANVYTNLGAIYYIKREYDKSLDYYQKAIDIYEKSGDSTKIAANWISIGTIHRVRKRFGNAFTCYEKASVIYERLNDQKGVAKCLRLTGMVYRYQKKYTKALTCYQKALRMNKTLKNKQEIGSVLRNMGSLYKTQKQHAIAIDYFQKSLKICTEIDDKRGMIKAYRRLGGIFKAQKKYTKAIEYYKNDLAACHKLGDKNELAGGLQSIGLVYYDQKNYPEMTDYYVKALKIRRALGQKIEKANCLNMLGFINSIQGNNKKALAYYEENLSMQRESGNVKKIAKCLNGIGVLYRQWSQYGKALDYYQKALEINEVLENNKGVAQNLGNMAIVYRAQGHYVKALEYFGKSYELHKNKNRKSNMATVLNNMGTVYSDQGNYAKALEYYKQALTINKALDNKKKVAIVLGNCGEVYHAQGDYAKAMEQYQKSITISKEIGYKLMEAAIITHIGDLELDKGNYAAALNQNFESFELYKSLGDNRLAMNSVMRIGDIYTIQKNEVLASEYYQQALKTLRDLGAQKGIGEVHHALGTLYEQQNQLEEALSYYKDALLCFDTLGVKAEKGETMTKIADIYRKSGNFNTALENYTKVLNIYQEIGAKTNLPAVHIGLATTYLKTGNNQTALFHAQKGLDQSRISGQKVWIQAAHKVLFQIYENLEKYQPFLYHHKQYTAYRDSLAAEKSSRQLTEVLTKYETEKKEQENELLKKQSLINEEAIKKQQILIFSVATGLVLAAVFLIFLFRAYRTKQQLSQKIQEINDTQSRWFNNIAHELRTPLTLILGPIRQFIKAHTDKPKIELAGIQLAEKNSTQLLHLINEILDISRLKSNRLKLNKQNTDLTELIRESVSHFSSALTEKGVVLTTSILIDINLYIDSDRIKNILINLISNALKFTHRGGKIEIVVEHEKEHMLEIRVKDTGEGIPEKDLPHVFERYYQVADAGRIHQGGIGIGLALSKELAEIHGGNLTAISHIEQGSTFTLALPEELIIDIQASNLKPPVIVGAKEKITHKPEPNIMNGNKDQPLVLLVEDNPDMRAYIRSFMMDKYQIAEAADGIEALAYLEKTIPDLIISDIMMPRMDGITLAKTLKKEEKYKNIPFITLTAKANESDKINTLRIGIDDYLTKPFNTEELEARVTNLIRNSRERIAAVSSEPEEISEPTFEDNQLAEMKTYVLSRLSDSTLSAKELAEVHHMSQRSLERKLKKITGLSPGHFIREVRLQQARSLLEARQFPTVLEVVYAVGFENASYFTKLFFERFGKKPSAYLLPVADVGSSRL